MIRTSSLEVSIRTHIDCTLNISSMLPCLLCFLCILTAPPVNILCISTIVLMVAFVNDDDDDRWQYRSIFIRFAVVASQICEITRNSKIIRTYSASRSSKVIHLGTNRKRICNFILVVNSKFGRSLSRTVSEILTHKARRALTRDRPHCPLTSRF